MNVRNSFVHITEPSEPLNLNVTSETDGIVKIVWDPPAEPNGPLNGYIVSWKCSPAETFTSITNETMATIEGKVVLVLVHDASGNSFLFTKYVFITRLSRLISRLQSSLMYLDLRLACPFPSVI